MRKVLAGLLTGLFLVGLAPIANAALSVGLDWLPFSFTINKSYTQVCAEYGLDANGYSDTWRYATPDEVVSLYTEVVPGWGGYYSNASQPHTSDIYNNAGYWGMTDGIGELLGYTHFNATGLRAVEIISRPAPGDYPLTLNRVSYIAPGGNPAGEERISHDSGWQPGYDLLDYGWAGSRSIASYLVRDASLVPVPSAIWLLGSGLIGLAGVNRRKK